MSVSDKIKRIKGQEFKQPAYVLFTHRVLGQQPIRILGQRNTLNNNWHKTMINAAYFRTLPIKNPRPLYKDSSLIKPARTSVHLYAQRGYGSRMQDISGANQRPNVHPNR